MSLIHLGFSALALDPAFANSLLADLFDAVPVVAGAPTPQARQARLIREMNWLRPRDPEEAILASQFLAAHHNAQACFAGLEGLNPASREASRLRRDAMALQRAALAAHSALHKSRARPMPQGAERVSRIPRRR